MGKRARRAPGERRSVARARSRGRASRPCRTWPWPAPGARSPARPATPAGRRPGRRWPERPGGPTPPPPRRWSRPPRAGSRSGTRRASSTPGAHPEASLFISPVTAALERSVTCERPSVSVHTTQLSTVPKQRSAVRSGSAWSRRWATLVADDVGRQADALRLEHQAVADRAQVLPADPGTDGAARGPLPEDGRGPLRGHAHGLDRPAGGEGLARHLQHGVGQGGGVELDEPGRRGGRQERAGALGLDREVGVHHGGPHAAGPDVDDEDAHPGAARRVASMAPTRPVAVASRALKAMLAARTGSSCTTLATTPPSWIRAKPAQGAPRRRWRGRAGARLAASQPPATKASRTTKKQRRTSPEGRRPRRRPPRRSGRRGGPPRRRGRRRHRRPSGRAVTSGPLMPASARSRRGSGRPSLPGLRMPAGSSAALTAPSTPKPGAERLGARSGCGSGPRRGGGSGCRRRPAPPGWRRPRRRRRGAPARPRRGRPAKVK